MSKKWQQKQHNCVIINTNVRNKKYCPKNEQKRAAVPVAYPPIAQYRLYLQAETNCNK
jgi:hypothetical protein